MRARDLQQLSRLLSACGSIDWPESTQHVGTTAMRVCLGPTPSPIVIQRWIRRFEYGPEAAPLGSHDRRSADAPLPPPFTRVFLTLAATTAGCNFGAE